MREINGEKPWCSDGQAERTKPFSGLAAYHQQPVLTLSARVSNWMRSLSGCARGSADSGLVPILKDAMGDNEILESALTRNGFEVFEPQVPGDGRILNLGVFNNCLFAIKEDGGLPKAWYLNKDEWLEIKPKH